MQKVLLPIVLAVTPAFSQQPKFELADIHTSPTPFWFAQNGGGRLRWALAGAFAGLGASRYVRVGRPAARDRRSGVERRIGHDPIQLERRSGADRRSGRDRRSGWDRRGSTRTSTYG